MAACARCMLTLWLILGILKSSNAQTKKTLTVTAIREEPILFENEGQFSGLLPDLLNRLGYNYSIYEPPDQRYGFLLQNGSWTGMIKELIEKKADLAGLLSVTSKRSEVIDFSYPVMSVGYSILMRKPARSERYIADNLKRLLSPMTLSVWLLSFLAMLMAAIVLYIIMHFSPYEWRRLARDHEATIREGESFTCVNTFFFVISTLMWQGYTHAPRSIGARILVVSWWAFTVIFIVSYTASLTNYLRVGPQKTIPVTSLSDLSTSDKIRIGMLPSGSTHAFFKNSKSLVNQRIYEKVIDDPMLGKLYTLSDLVRYLRDQDTSAPYSLILESSTAKFIANRKPCDLISVHSGYAVKQIAFGLQKNSPLTDEINMALMKLADSGELHDIELKWYRPKCQGAVLSMHDDDVANSQSFNPLDLGTFTTALLIVVAGIVLGSFVCVIEICIYKWAEAHPVEDKTEPINTSGTKTTEPEAKQQLLPIVTKPGGTSV